MGQEIINCNQLSQDLHDIIKKIDFDKLFVLTDTHTCKLCFPRLKQVESINDIEPIVIPAGDVNKNIQNLSDVWSYLSEKKATRKSLLINLGGGMLTDLGGFAAATFKRGIRFINIPTTLLGAVDAATGGKTGINFNGLKNEVGVFAPAEYVLIDSEFFKTLDHANLLSGYAEVLKHSLLESEEEWKAVLTYDIDRIDYDRLRDLAVSSVKVKEKIVKEDPFEKGIRKALNLGHTFGHAFESISYEMQKPALHGYAVAWGMVCELYLSFRILHFNQDKMLQTIRFIKHNYDGFTFDCRQYDRLYELMQHDKKNESSHINFTLLSDIGKIEIDQDIEKDKIFEALDFYREFFGC